MITDSHVRSQVAPYDHAEDVSIFSDIALQFRQAMSLDRSVKMKYEVSSINKVSLREWLCLLNLPPLHPPNPPPSLTNWLGVTVHPLTINWLGIMVTC